MKRSPTGEERARVTHRSLERGLAVLASVAAAGRPASLAETARRVGLHRSTAHHLTQTLVSAGYLRQDATTRGYELTQSTR
jgi:DNA-binding IclR family transcriptional regulator